MKTPDCEYKYPLSPESLPDGTKLPAKFLCTRLPEPDPALGFANLLAKPEEYWEDCILDIKDRHIFVSFPFGYFKGKRIELPFDYSSNGYSIRVERLY